MFPSLVCKRQSLCSILSGCSEPAPVPFNEIRIIDPEGNWYFSYFCDATLSTFLPQQSAINPMTGTEFGELWPSIVLLLLTGYCVKILLKVFAP